MTLVTEVFRKILGAKEYSYQQGNKYFTVCLNLGRMAVSLQYFMETHHREAPGSEHRSPWIGTEHTAIVEMKKVHERACLH